MLEKLERTTDATLFYSGEYARDLLRRKQSTNIEVVVRGLPLLEIAAFIKKYYNNIRIDKVNGAITISANGKDIVLYLPRKGGKPDPSATLKEDAKDRILTLNALYLPIAYKNRMKSLIDPYSGLGHLRRKTLSTVVKADSMIKSNPSIMMSAMAIAAKLGYRIDTNLFYAIKANAKLAEKLSIEEIRDAFITILLCNKPSRYIKLLKDTNLLSVILPEIDLCDGIIQNKKYHKYDVFRHCVVACDATDPTVVMRLAALLHDVGKPVTVKEIFKNGTARVTFYDHEVVGAKVARKMLRRLKFDDEIVTEVSELVYNHMYNYEPERWTDAAIRRFIKRFGITAENVDSLATMPVFLLRQADRAASGRDLKKISPRQYDLEDRIREMIDSTKGIKVTDLAVDGAIVMSAFSLQPGPTVGHILNYLLSKVAEDPALNTKEKLLEEISNYLSSALK